METALSLIALVTAVGWNIAATNRVAGSMFYDGQKKRAQYLLIWLLPFVGATIAFFMTEEESTKPLTTDLTEKSEKCDYELRPSSASSKHASDHMGDD